jgi:hypothetical protein
MSLSSRGFWRRWSSGAWIIITVAAGMAAQTML